MNNKSTFLFHCYMHKQTSKADLKLSLDSDKLKSVRLLNFLWREDSATSETPPYDVERSTVIISTLQQQVSLLKTFAVMADFLLPRVYYNIGVLSRLFCTRGSAAATLSRAASRGACAARFTWGAGSNYFTTTSLASLVTSRPTPKQG